MLFACITCGAGSAKSATALEIGKFFILLIFIGAYDKSL